MFECPSCGHCPVVQLLDSAGTVVLCEKALALGAANVATRRAREAAVSLVDVLEELQAVRRQLVRWDAAGLPPTRRVG